MDFFLTFSICPQNIKFGRLGMHLGFFFHADGRRRLTGPCASKLAIYEYTYNNVYNVKQIPSIEITQFIHLHRHAQVHGVFFLGGG